MSHLPVRFIEELVWRLTFDPEHQALLRDHKAAAERIQRGETTPEQEWGPSLSGDELRDELDRMFPGGPRRYPLPKHLHWMGEWAS